MTPDEPAQYEPAAHTVNADKPVPLQYAPLGHEYDSVSALALQNLPFSHVTMLPLVLGQ